MAVDDLAALQDACSRAEKYPRTVLSSHTPEHTLRNLQDQMNRRKGTLFSNELDASVGFWELARIDEGMQKLW